MLDTSSVFRGIDHDDLVSVSLSLSTITVESDEPILEISARDSVDIVFK
jgi:hypothetical protein